MLHGRTVTAAFCHLIRLLFAVKAQCTRVHQTSVFPFYDIDIFHLFSVLSLCIFSFHWESFQVFSADHSSNLASEPESAEICILVFFGDLC